MVIITKTFFVDGEVKNEKELVDILNALQIKQCLRIVNGRNLLIKIQANLEKLIKLRDALDEANGLYKISEI